jgi:hypothetical protein
MHPKDLINLTFNLSVLQIVETANKSVAASIVCSCNRQVKENYFQVASVLITCCLVKTSVRDVKVVEQLRQLSRSGNTVKERVKNLSRDI